MRTWICARCYTRTESGELAACPSCKGTEVVPVDTPRGRQLLAQVFVPEPAAPALAPPTPSATSSWDAWAMLGKSLALFIGGPALVILLCYLAVKWKEDHDSTAVPGAHRPAAYEPRPPPEEQALRVPSTSQATTLAEAVEATRPAMVDIFNSPSIGGAALAIWAGTHLKWSDLAITKNETSFGLVRKDRDSQLGKRMCIRGELIQIAGETVSGVTIYNGLLIDADWDVTHFLAVGSTGSLVAKSRARFCGVVVGNYDYTNSAGGTGHAVSLVGMFDLPENKK